MSYENIRYETSGAVATITIDRPKALNALNEPTLRELLHAFGAVAADRNVRVVILTGGGEKAFVAGADIRHMADLSPLEGRRFARLGLSVCEAIERLDAPVIAAVNGYALGGGTELALACDLVYASSKARFGQPEVNLGIIPGFGGTQRLARLVGANLARELIFSGRMLSAEEAREAHIVSRLFAPQELLESVMAVADQITRKGRASLMLAKTAIRKGLDTDLNTGLAIERDAFALCQTSPDSREGTGAFLEKRNPDFTGRRFE